MSWDTTLPADNEAASQGASRIRTFKTDIQTALTVEGSFPVDAAAPQFYPKLKKDTTGNRPAASANYPGRMFYNSTTGTLQRVKDDGSDWEDVFLNPNTQAIHQAAASSIASVVGVVTLPETGNAFNVTGTEAVTSITGWSTGVVIIKWSSGRVITHSATLTLRGSANRTVLANDVSIFLFSAAGTCREIGYYSSALAAAGSAPTRQTFTSGSGTYTTPANCTQLRIRMVGGGGGGGARVTNDGAAGSSTTFNAIAAAGGSGGKNGGSSGQAGGAGGAAGAGSATLRASGQAGNNGQTNQSSGYSGAAGGASLLGFGAAAAINGGGGTGQDAAANTGGGGGGALGTNSAGAGGGGEYVELVISSPSATYAYAVGAGGAGGAAGTIAGGAGGSGIIIVDEIY